MAFETSRLLLLLNWMSPAFPVGAFAYSHGLEWAIASGTVRTAEEVEAWIADLISSGSGWTDAVLFARCWHDDPDELNVLALALAGSLERHRETTQLGGNFRKAASVWTDAILGAGDIAYPVAAGSICRSADIPQEMAVAAFLQGFCAALVSVAVRLVPLGQMQGLKVLRILSTKIAGTTKRACRVTLDNLGANTIMSEIAAMKHETLEPRIFIT
jgi:urease accessory protein